jgi:hypothetical protein
MTLVAELLRTGGLTLESLKEKYAVSHKRHKRYPNIITLKYSQIDSPMGEQVPRECRGLVLDEDDSYREVSRAFDKFFNHGEGHAAPIDWSTASCQEKVDGSLCVVYPYKGEWHVATTGTPDAGGPVNREGFTFADYFWKTIGDDNPFASMVPDVHNVCFFFELSGPANRIVVVHEKPSLTILGARVIGATEISAASARAYLSDYCFDPPPAVKSYPLQSWAEVEATFAVMSPLRQEGYVIVDGSFNRVKVKHPGYVALHHAKDGMTEKAFVEIARAGEVSEVLTAFPEFRPMMDSAKSRVDALIARIEADYSAVRHIHEQKPFALEAVKRPMSGALFALRSGKATTAREYVAGMRIETLMDAMEVHSVAHGG